jgi:O-antigen/teichoic acid export membrane protein
MSGGEATDLEANKGPDRPSRTEALLDKAKGLHRRKFVRETVIMQGGMFVTLATYLLTSVVLARGLGPFQFGRYTIAFSLYTFIFFIGNLGLTTTAVSRYSQACGAGDAARKVRVLAQFLRVFAMMAFAIVALGGALPWIGATIYDDARLGWLSWGLCLLGPVELVNAFMLVVLQGGRRAADYVIYDNASGITRLVVILFALMVDPALESVIAAYLVSGVAYAWYGARLYQLARREADPAHAPPPLREVVREAWRVDTEGMFTSGALIAIGKNGSQLFRSLAFLLVGNHAGNTSVAHFRVAFFFMWAVQQFLGGLQRSLLPALGFRLGKSGNDEIRFRRDIIRVCLGSGVLFIAVTAVLCLMAPTVIRFLYGARYSGAIDYVYILAVGHLVLGFSVVSEAFYIFTHQVPLSAKLNVAMLLALMVGAWWGISAFGAIGGAWVFAISQLLGIVHLVVMGRYFGTRERGLPA